MRPINLLPRSALPRAPRLRTITAAAIIAWLVVLAFATVATQGRISDAERATQTVQRDVDRLTREIADLSDVRDAMQEYDVAAATVAALLDGDVSWADIMASLSSQIPSRVWLEGFTGTTASDDPDGFGQITMTGVAFDFPDVSVWIRSLDASTFPGVAGAWVQSVSESTIGAAEVVVFSSTTRLTEDALSDRLRARAPEVR